MATDITTRLVQQVRPFRYYSPEGSRSIFGGTAKNGMFQKSAAFNLPALWDWQSIGVLHYQYEKPWEKDHPRVEQLRPLIDLWHAYLAGENIPDVAMLANPAQQADPASP